MTLAICSGAIALLRLETVTRLPPCCKFLKKSDD